MNHSCRMNSALTHCSQLTAQELVFIVLNHQLFSFPLTKDALEDFFKE